MMVAAVKNNAKVKTYNFKSSWSNKAQFDAKSFVRRSKDGHKARASYYNDERPSLENSRLKPQSSDLQKFKHQQQRRRKLKLQNKVSNKRPCSKEKNSFTCVNSHHVAVEGWKIWPKLLHF